MCFFFKQKTAYEMRISDWSSDVCSSDLGVLIVVDRERQRAGLHPNIARREREAFTEAREDERLADRLRHAGCAGARDRVADPFALCDVRARLEKIGRAHV